jgi:uncharacterized protein (TIGR03083 family)
MDAITEWTNAQERVIELAESLSDEEGRRSVPATPAWTVTELLAHMVGLTADVVAGDEPDDHNSTWTQRQVDRRAGRVPAELVAEWRTLTQPMQDFLRGREPRPLNDIVIHEQDLRGAVGRPGGRDSSALATVRDVMAERFATRVRKAHLPPVQLRSPAWIFSTGDGDPGLELFAPDFDLVRALMTRRTEDQLRQWSTAGAIDPYLPVFAGLGPLPEQPLPE